MTKQRIEGRVNGGNYEVIGHDGGVMTSVPLGEARKDKKLAAAIKRNGWDGIPATEI